MYHHFCFVLPWRHFHCELTCYSALIILVVQRKVTLYMKKGLKWIPCYIPLLVRYCFNLFRELVDCHQKVSMASLGRFLEWSNHVEPPLGEGPRQWYRLQCWCGCVWLCGELLTADALSDYVLRVFECCRPVKPYVKGFGYEWSTAGMMPVGTCMNITKDGLAIFESYASLEHT